MDSFESYTAAVTSSFPFHLLLNYKENFQLRYMEIRGIMGFRVP